VRLVPLASGSRGNATLVEFGRTRMLVDAGLSARALARSLERVGVAPGAVGVLLLSHEHEDHARGAEVFSRTHGVPVLCSVETLEALDVSPRSFAAWHPLGPLGCEFEGIRIEPFPLPHDAVAPVGFVLHGQGLRIGIATDLGHATPLVLERLRGCHLQMLEANHDDRLLRDGPYPPRLKRRVAGRLGHLSNLEASAVLEQTVDADCRCVVLAHLSEQNNTPSLARRAALRALGTDPGRRVALRVAAGPGPLPGVEL